MCKHFSGGEPTLQQRPRRVAAIRSSRRTRRLIRQQVEEDSEDESEQEDPKDPTYDKMAFERYHWRL
jgi:hypothetical protein